MRNFSAATSRTVKAADPGGRRNCAPRPTKMTLPRRPAARTTRVKQATYFSCVTIWRPSRRRARRRPSCCGFHRPDSPCCGVRGAARRRGPTVRGRGLPSRVFGPAGGRLAGVGPASRRWPRRSGRQAAKRSRNGPLHGPLRGLLGLRPGLRPPLHRAAIRGSSWICVFIVHPHEKRGVEEHGTLSSPITFYAKAAREGTILRRIAGGPRLAFPSPFRPRPPPFP